MSDKEYDIEIKETYSTIIKVEASSEKEAIKKAREKYHQEEVRLTSEENDETDISMASENGNNKREDIPEKARRRKESEVLRLAKKHAKLT